MSYFKLKSLSVVVCAVLVGARSKTSDEFGGGAMRIFLTCIVVAAALSLAACGGRSTSSNPTAFCSAYKKIGVEEALNSDALNSKLTVSDIVKEAAKIAAAYQKLAGIAPTEIESAVQAQADYASLVMREMAKAKDPTATPPAPEMEKLLAARKKAHAASDPINTWTDAYCKN